MRRPFSPTLAPSPSDPPQDGGGRPDGPHLRELDELRGLFEALTIGLTLWEVGDPQDLDSLRLRYANPALMRVTGIDREARPGDRPRDLFPAWLLDPISALLEGLRETGAAQGIENIAPRASGIPRRGFDLRVFSLPSRSIGISFTELSDALTAMQALTALTASEQRFRALWESNRDLESFAYVASHDLQEPLRKIIAFGERMKIEEGDTLSERGQVYLDRMAGSATRMQRMIDDLLELSRVATRGARFERLDLTEVVATVLEILEEEIDRAGARIEVVGLPTIEADRMQMQQLFQNLLANAIKFRSADRALEIRLRAAAPEPDSAGKESVRIEVEDNGIGFDMKHRERVFQPFERLHARSVFEGTGIGLSICRRIVERHGGAIGVDSVPGEGSRFRIRLPLRHKVQEEGT